MASLHQSPDPSGWEFLCDSTSSDSDFEKDRGRGYFLQLDVHFFKLPFFLLHEWPQALCISNSSSKRKMDLKLCLEKSSVNSPSNVPMFKC